MQTIELSQEKLNNLLNVLDRNKRAVSSDESVRWTPESAEQIEQLREYIADQIQ